MPKYVVNDWYQIEWDGKTLTGGDTFSADAEAVASAGLNQYVSLVPVEEKAAEPSPNKAQSSGPNKAKTTKK